MARAAPYDGLLTAVLSFIRPKTMLLRTTRGLSDAQPARLFLGLFNALHHTVDLASPSQSSRTGTDASNLSDAPLPCPAHSQTCSSCYCSGERHGLMRRSFVYDLYADASTRGPHKPSVSGSSPAGMLHQQHLSRRGHGRTLHQPGQSPGRAQSSHSFEILGVKQCRSYASAAAGSGDDDEAGAAVSGSRSRSLPPHVEAKLAAKYNRYQELEQLISRGEGSPAELRDAGQEYSSLTQVALSYSALIQAREELVGAEALASDPDPALRSLAKEEAAALTAQIQGLVNELLVSLVPSDPQESRAAMLEVRAGAGGDEASLFAAELLRMYQHHAESQGWTFQLVEYNGSEVGGCRSASAAVGGDGVYGRLRHEAGVHRVQRVPATETQGRIHTSTASVVVLPQADEVDVVLREADLRVETMRASGAGGQHVNVTDSAVRVTHLPSGISVSCQAERSQHQNRAQALKVLRARIYDMEMRKRAREAAETRQAAMGSSERNERIRTYNFPQGRITDHRVGLTLHGMEAMLQGELLPTFTQALAEQDQQARLEQLLMQ